LNGATGNAEQVTKIKADISISGTTYGVWYSGSTGMWTNVAGVASALSLTSGVSTAFSVRSGLSLSSAINSAKAAYLAMGGVSGLTTQVFSTHSIDYWDSNIQGARPITYWTDGGKNWTTEKPLGESLGYSQVTLDLQPNQRIDYIMEQLKEQLGKANRQLGSITFAEAGAPRFDAAVLNVEKGERLSDAVQIDSKIVRIGGFVDPTKQITMVGDGRAGYFNAEALATAINQNKDSAFWAMLDQTNEDRLYVFRKDGGDNNGLLACDVYGIDPVSQAAREKFINFEHVESGIWHSGGTTFSLGTTAADVWGKMKPIQTKEKGGTEVWNVTLNGKDVGSKRDLWIAAARELTLPGIDDSIISGLDRYSFMEVQNASDGKWAGADVRTQSNAQAALDALNYSIDVKDKIRADLGALQNRLENTMTNLEIQAENLQASESRISDVDVAWEMTEFTKNNVLTQAAVGMLAQANSLSQLALSLIGG
jgi:flagellin-like hook-associated protein FlgL